MGNELCCYKNVSKQNLDPQSGINIINNNPQLDTKVITLNYNINTNLKENSIKKKSTKEEKITAYSTALMSKTVSFKNLKQSNLIKNPHTYFDKELVITKEAIDENICKIQRIFHNNLKKKNQRITEKEEVFNRKKKISRANSIKYKNEIIKSIENDMKIYDEPNIIYSTYRNSRNNLSMNSEYLESISSFYSKIDSLDISNEPKGFFLNKKKKYTYKGKRDSEGKKTGFGIIIWNDGSQIKSIFKNSKINGYGIFEDKRNENCEFYGNYKDNIPLGYGYYIKGNLKLEGDNWEKNNLNGIGMEIWDDDNFYQGEFNKSEKNGIGLYRWPDGTLCFGEWKNNKLNGYGLMKYSNDSIYVGEFKNNLMHGLGEFLWGDAEYYCGNYINGFKEGFGIYVWNFDKISCYIGFWENGKQHGVGIKIIDGIEKVGLYKDGRKNNNLNGPWEIKEYLKPEYLQYQKFLQQNTKLLISYVMGLKHNEILVESSFTIN